ncbi:hypothetical protein PENTCL1PPCAC_19311, partial [Pristionchus entomophagus]
QDRKASRLPVLSQRPAARSRSVPASSNEPEAIPRRQRSLRKPQSRIPQYTVPVVSIDSTASPSSKRSTVRQRAERRRSQELADLSSSSDENQADSEAKKIRVEAEHLIDSLSPAHIEQLFGDEDIAMDNEWVASTEKFEQIERLHLGSLPSPSFLPPELAAPINYLDEMERIATEGGSSSPSRLVRVADWVDRVTPGVPSSDESRGRLSGDRQRMENAGTLFQNPVRTLLAGLAASSQQTNNNAEPTGEVSAVGQIGYRLSSIRARSRQLERQNLIDSSTSCLLASVDLMEKSADLLEAAAAELHRKRSREAEHSSLEMLDRSEQLLEQSAAELQRKKKTKKTFAPCLRREENKSLQSMHIVSKSRSVQQLFLLVISTVPRSTSPARQETYGRSSAFYGLGSLDDLPEPPPHLQSPPSSGER